MNSNYPQRKRPVVIVEKLTASAVDCIHRVLDRTGIAETMPWLAGPVLVKPNLTVAAHPSGGAVTSPETVRCVVNWLRSRGARNIIVGDGSTIGTRSEELFEVTGYKRLCRELEVPLVDLNNDAAEALSLPGARLLKTVMVSRTAARASLIVNIPVWKTHIHTGVTLALKNLKGIILPSEKKRCHLEGLDRAVADLSLLPLRQLVLADGSTGQEGLGPLTGTPRRAGYVVAGTHPLSVDIICSWMMGFNPPDIKHLALAAVFDKSLPDPSSTEVKGPLIRLSPPFKQALEVFEKTFSGVTVMDEGACSACLGGVLVALHRMKQAKELDQLRDRFGIVTVAVGPGEKTSAGTVIRVGNCQCDYKTGSLVRGCPPQGWLIRDALRALLGLPPLFPLS
ncbi:MAG: DUF362 domain-containing protein [bacterium]|nr:DUF362 domain-containing protein [bacterium]